MFIQFRLPALQDIYPVAFARTVLAPPRTMGIGRKDTTRSERQRGRSSKFTMYIRPHFPILLGKLHHEDIKNTLQHLKKSLRVNDVGPGVALILNNKFKVMFEIYRVIEIWRQIVGIVRRIVYRNRESRRTFESFPRATYDCISREYKSIE